MATLFTFSGGDVGDWKVESVAPVTGESLAPCERIAITKGAPASALDSAWSLRGVVSSLRYTTKDELDELRTKGPNALGRPEATLAALIPIKKNAAWWALAQDERAAIINSGRHFALGIEYMPAVSRRLHHCHDLVGEPFDFLTLFEYSPDNASAFEEMVARLRATPEWGFVEREVDIRMSRE